VEGAPGLLRFVVVPTQTAHPFEVRFEDDHVLTPGQSSNLLVEPPLTNRGLPTRRSVAVVHHAEGDPERPAYAGQHDDVGLAAALHDRYP
jgi:hypothetical protein